MALPRLGFALAAAFILWVTFCPKAGAHEWYSNYNIKGSQVSCCGGEDCGPLDEAPKWTPEGYLVPTPGGLVLFKHDRVYASPDMQYHACIRYSSVLCLFVPGSV